MNEYMTTVLVVFSEIGVVLGIFVTVILFSVIRRNGKNKALAKELVAKIKNDESDHRAKLEALLQDASTIPEDEAEKLAEKVIVCEKSLYSRIIKLFLGREKYTIARIQRDVETLAGAYQNLVRITQQNNAQNSELIKKLEMEIQTLAQGKEKLATDLDESMKSMEVMLKEYTSMYADGAKKDGVKYLNNELSQLKQKLSSRK